MALHSFRDGRRLWGVRMHSLLTRKDTWDLSPPSAENHPVTPSPPAPELKFKAKSVSNSPCIRPCSHPIPSPWGRKPHRSHIPSHLRSTWPGGPVGGCGYADTLQVTPAGILRKKDAISDILQKTRILSGAPPGILLSFYLLMNGFKTFSLLSPGLILPFQSSD